MATLRNREEYLDELGRTWAIEVEIHDGYRDLFLVTPGHGRRWHLSPKHTPRPRPRRDAEEPLPLEIP
jgi:hypothetical protein